MRETACKGEKMIIRMVTIILVAAVPMLLECSNSPVANGSGSTTETAMVYNPGGSPAVNAKVRFYPVNHVPKSGLPKTAASIDSATTDKNGKYTVALDTGAYNMLVSGDSGLSYQDSITIKADTTSVPADTLGAPGSLKGVVRLQPGDDARTVFLLFMGTNTWGTPDDSTGKFTIANMAEGSYRVRILTTLDLYVPKDTMLSFTAGKADTLPHDIVLQYTGIPVPSGLAITYDTLKQIVTLAWSKPTTGRTVSGYNIYRKHQDSILVKIKSDLQDTIFRDSSGIQDIAYEYRVAAVDTNGTEGVKSIEVATIIAPQYILFKSLECGENAKLNTPGDLDVAPNGDIYIADEYGNAVVVFNDTGTFKFTFGKDVLIQPLAIKIDKNNSVYVGYGGYLKNGGSPKVNIYDLNGILKASFGDSGYSMGKISYISDIEVSSSNKVYIVDEFRRTILSYDTSGTFTGELTVVAPPQDTIGVSGIKCLTDSIMLVGGSTLAGIKVIAKIDIHSQGIIDLLTEPQIPHSIAGLEYMNNAILVTDYSNKQILMLDMSGNIVSHFGRRTENGGELYRPTNIRIGRDGRIIVTQPDYPNICRLLIYNLH
jgi:hypothetical protein